LPDAFSRRFTARSVAGRSFADSLSRRFTARIVAGRSFAR